MTLAVALGNPGKNYEKTRHNAGWILVDEIISNWSPNKYAQAREATTDSILYVKPQTFMNDSGTSLSWYVKHNSLVGEQCVVIHDDIDLPFGTMRIAYDRGSAGHNGVKSIAEHVGSNAFVRVRVGVAPLDKESDEWKFTPRADFVLNNFSPDDFELLRKQSSKLQAILQTIAKEGYVKAMNEFNVA